MPQAFITRLRENCVSPKLIIRQYPEIHLVPRLEADNVEHIAALKRFQSGIGVKVVFRAQLLCEWPHGFRWQGHNKVNIVCISTFAVQRRRK